MPEFTFEQTLAAITKAAMGLISEGHHPLTVAHALLVCGTSGLAANPADPRMIPALETMIENIRAVLADYHAATRPKGQEH